MLRHGLPRAQLGRNTHDSALYSCMAGLPCAPEHACIQSDGLGHICESVDSHAGFKSQASEHACIQSDGPRYVSSVNGMLGCDPSPRRDVSLRPRGRLLGRDTPRDGPRSLPLSPPPLATTFAIDTRDEELEASWAPLPMSCGRQAWKECDGKSG